MLHHCRPYSLKLSSITCRQTPVLLSRRQLSDAGVYEDFRVPGPYHPPQAYKQAVETHMKDVSIKGIPKWIDASITDQQGRIFPVDTQLLPANETITFPRVPCVNLDGKDILFPHVDADVKLVVLSFKHYGFTVARSWLDPFLLQKRPSMVALEICFVEYALLSVAKSFFAHGVRGLVQPSQVDKTFLSFGKTHVSLMTPLCLCVCFAVLVCVCEELCEGAQVFVQTMRLVSAPALPPLIWRFSSLSPPQ